MLHLYTFGGLRIEHEEQPLQLPTQKARDLLAYLITYRDCPHSRPVLAGTFWPDLPEEKARRRLSDTLWRVRRAVGDHVMADDECIWFGTNVPYWLDAEQFQSTVYGPEPGISDPNPLEHALTLYRGPFLDGLYHDHGCCSMIDALVYLLDDCWMDSRFQPPQGGRIAKDDSTQLGPIYRATRSQDLWTKGFDYRAIRRSVGLHHLVGNLIGINDASPQLGQHPSHFALARGDVAGQTDQERMAFQPANSAQRSISYCSWPSNSP